MLTPGEIEALLLSLRVALTAVGISLPFALVLAYGLARRKIPFALLLENLVQFPLVVPPVVVGYLFLIALSPAGTLGSWLDQVLGLRIPFTWWGAALASATVSFPLLVQPVKVAIEQISPELEEAVFVYGGGRLQVLRWITLPLAARGIGAGMVLGFARAVGEFGATIILAGNIPGVTQTLPLAIFTELSRPGGESAVLRLVGLSLLLSLGSLIAYHVLTRRYGVTPE